MRVVGGLAGAESMGSSSSYRRRAGGPRRSRRGAAADHPKFPPYGLALRSSILGHPGATLPARQAPRGCHTTVRPNPTVKAVGILVLAKLFGRVVVLPRGG